MKALRIAMIGTRGAPTTFGGVERAVEELSARLASAGHEVTLYCRPGYVQTRVRTHRGIRLRYLPAVNTKHLEAISHTLLATLDAIVRRYDIVHYHALGPNLCSPLARAAGLRVVTTVHSLDFRAGKWGRLARLILRLGAWIAAHVPHRTLVVSRELEKFFALEYGCATTYVPNGVEIGPDPERSPEGKHVEQSHFLFLGRLVPEKDVHTLIEAYGGVDTDLPLVIAGPPSYSKEYESLLRRRSEADSRVRLVGPVYGHRKAKLIEEAYAFCQTSTHEGLPIVLLEVMSEGICPIVSDIPEHLEIVSPDAGDRAAIVFSAGSVTSLRDAITEALRNPERVAEMGVAARRLVAARYGLSKVAADVECVYREVIRR